MDAKCLKDLEWAINSDAQQLNLLCIWMINKLWLYLPEQTGIEEVIAAVDATLTNPLYLHGCRHTTG